MPLNLKETPEEKAEREWRRQQRAKRKGTHHTDRPRKKARRDTPLPTHRDFIFDEDGWIPPESSRKPPDAELRSSVEDRWFREKLFDAMEDDMRGDALSNAYSSYRPQRWKHAVDDSDAVPDPELNEEEYAEWVRRGMWRRTHKAEVEETERLAREIEEKKKAERKWRAAEEAKDKEKERKREERRRAKEEKALVEAWETYESVWARMVAVDILTFETIPWPAFEHITSPSQLTRSSIEEFLLSQAHSKDKSRKERHRDALLRWHPDKFEGRWMAKVPEKEKTKVREGVGIVVRCLGDMANDNPG